LRFQKKKVINGGRRKSKRRKTSFGISKKGSGNVSGTANRQPLGEGVKKPVRALRTAREDTTKLRWQRTGYERNRMDLN